MKKIVLFILLVGLFIIQSCADGNEAKSAEDKPPLSVSGKVYGLRSDTINCAQILPCNSYMPRLLFLNDSLFVKVVRVNCEDIGMDFTCWKNYSGKYKISDKSLILNFDSNMVMHYIKSKNDPKTGPLILANYQEQEKADMTMESLERVDCKSNAYFIPCDLKGHVMILTTDQIKDHIQYLKDENIWESLF
jgi:hypothetical protein